MAETNNMQYIQPYNNDVYAGHLSTPISDSGLTRTFINNLPAYREGISPLLRGLEIGMAHGYFLVGPWTLLGPLRDSDGYAYLGGLISAIALILVATAGLSAYGLAAFPSDNSEAQYFDHRAPENLKTRQGWSQFAGGFFIGAMGGAFVAYFLLENLSVVDSILRGTIN